MLLSEHRWLEWMDLEHQAWQRRWAVTAAAVAGRSASASASASASSAVASAPVHPFRSMVDVHDYFEEVDTRFVSRTDLGPWQTRAAARLLLLKQSLIHDAGLQFSITAAVAASQAALAQAEVEHHHIQAQMEANHQDRRRLMVQMREQEKTVARRKEEAAKQMRLARARAQEQKAKVREWINPLCVVHFQCVECSLTRVFALCCLSSLLAGC
jgi:hypothetical protein